MSQGFTQGIVLSGASSSSFLTKTVISEDELSGDQASFDFTSIPATYDDLEIVFTLQTDQAVTESDINLEFNGDTTAGNYRYSVFRTGILGSGSSVLAVTNGDDNLILQVPGSSSQSTDFARGVIHIRNYANTSINKVAYGRCGYRPASGNPILSIYGVMDWESTAAINQVTISVDSGDNFVAQSKVRLIGIKETTLVTG